MQHETIHFEKDVGDLDPLDEAAADVGKRRASKKRRKGSGRVCRGCGKDPYPNYFYCPPCHHRVSHLGMEEEHEDHRGY